jgi:1,4-dihydroxy-2-naphthoate polyprenyltransferase
MEHTIAKNTCEYRMLIKSMRPAFLLLTLCCVFLGVGITAALSVTINMWYVFLIFLAATMSHISVNTFNEYFDFKNGLDQLTKRTPFSGGSGMLPEHPNLSSAVLYLAVFSLTVTVITGTYLALTINGWLIPLGVLGVVIVALYTPYITRSPLFSLITPGFAFGPIMIVGTGMVLSGGYRIEYLLASLVPFFLVNNLLLLNQFPDVLADHQVGRLNYPILIGKKKSAMIFVIFNLMAYLALLVSAYLDGLNSGVLLGLITLLISIPCMFGVLKHAEDTKKLLNYLRINVLINLFTPLLMGIGLIFG